MTLSPFTDSDTGLFRKRWRKKKPRNINYTPTLTVREPTDGVKDDEVIILWHDEIEALRLKNINGLGVVTAAKQMKISKSLFAKIHNDATKKVSQALIYGKSLHIEVSQPQELHFPRPLL